MRKNLMNWKKYLYLYKLILLIFVVIFLPITFLLQTFWKQSFDKMKANNEAYYGNVLELFTDGVVSNILEMVEHSASIIAYSKEPKSAFYNGCDGIMMRLMNYSKHIDFPELIDMEYTIMIWTSL